MLKSQHPYITITFPGTDPQTGERFRKTITIDGDEGTVDLNGYTLTFFEHSFVSMVAGVASEYEMRLQKANDHESLRQDDDSDEGRKVN